MSSTKKQSKAIKFVPNVGRRTALAALAVSAFAISAPQAALAAYPEKPIRLVIPFPPGGPTDVSGRMIAQYLGDELKQTVVVENRPGASGTVAAVSTAKAAADGYTFMVLANPTILAPHLYGEQAFDLFKDFEPVATTVEFPIVMIVNPQALPGVTNLQELVAKAKADPNLNYTSAGNGSFGHLSTELIKSMGGFQMQHVPYKGSAPAMVDLLGGTVQVMFSDMLAALPHIQGGKVIPIAVGSADRVDFAPDVKTVSEQGFPGFVATSWGGWVTPAGTPKEAIDVVSNGLKVVLANPELQEKLKSVGAYSVYQTPEEMGARVRSDYDKWGKVIRDNNIRNN